MNLKWLLCGAVVLTCASWGEAMFSSFWAPLYDRRVTGYRVDAEFAPDAGRLASPGYRDRYGARGRQLIDDLGSGKPPTSSTGSTKGDEVRFYYN